MINILDLHESTSRGLSTYPIPHLNDPMYPIAFAVVRAIVVVLTFPRQATRHGLRVLWHCFMNTWRYSGYEH